MKILRLATLALTFSFAGWLGCGGGGGAGGSGGTTSIGPVGTGGGSGGYVDAAPSPDGSPDQAFATPDLSLAPDASGGEAASASPGGVSCAGLTPAQCHDRMINPSVLPDGVLGQDPGANPVLPYPECTAL